MKPVKKILITGGSGFIGKNFSRYFRKITKFLPGKKIKKNKKNLIYLKSNLLNKIKFNELCDIIIHCSAKSPINNKFTHHDYKNNIIMTKNLIDHSKKFKPKK